MVRAEGENRGKSGAGDSGRHRRDDSTTAECSHVHISTATHSTLKSTTAGAITNADT